MVKLLDFRQEWEALEQDHNPFALVVMAHLETQRLKGRPIELAEVKFNLAKRLLERGYTHQYVIKFFLGIDWLMLLPPELETRFRIRIADYTKEQKMPLLSRSELDVLEEGRVKGLEEGMQEGLKQGMVIVIVSMLEKRLGKVTQKAKGQLNKLTSEQLQELGNEILTFSTRAELTNWLQQHSGQ